MAQDPETRTKKCGPDVTDFLIETLKNSRAEVQAHQLGAFGLILLANALLNKEMSRKDAWGAAQMIGFTNYVEGSGNLNKDGFESDNCPRDCPRTVTLCKMCVDHSVPEDINFIYAGKGSFTKAVLVGAANAVAFGTKGRLEKPEVAASFCAGDALSKLTKEELCKAIKKCKVPEIPCPLCPEKYKKKKG